MIELNQINQLINVAEIVRAPDTFTVTCPHCRTTNPSPGKHPVWTAHELWTTNSFKCVGCESEIDIPTLENDQTWSTATHSPLSVLVDECQTIRSFVLDFISVTQDSQHKARLENIKEILERGLYAAGATF